jgi:hypothetical protein
MSINLPLEKTQCFIHTVSQRKTCFNAYQGSKVSMTICSPIFIQYIIIIYHYIINYIYIYVWNNIRYTSTYIYIYIHIIYIYTHIIYIYTYHIYIYVSYICVCDIYHTLSLYIIGWVFQGLCTGVVAATVGHFGHHGDVWRHSWRTISRDFCWESPP